MPVMGWLASVKGVRSSHFFQGYHLWATIFWMCMVPVSIITGLWHSIDYVTLLSLWALVSTEWGAWQGSRAEVKAEEAVVETNTADVQADTVNVEANK